MFVIRLAELNIGIENKFLYIYDMCRDYVTNEKPDFIVSVTDSEISREYRGLSGDEGYFESLAIYRKIAEKVIYYNTFLLHGVVIDVEGCGVGFLAKSGMGKTTHMLLWKKLLKNKITVVNGDKPLIRVTDGKIYAYGTPWAGKEKFQTNTRTDLKNICFIERSLKNKCILLNKEEAFNRIVNQVYMPGSTDLIFSILELIYELIDKTDFYLIKCNTDISAAKVAYSKIINNI